MYLEHFGLSAPPFRITPHPEFFFDGAHRGETLSALIYAVQAGEGLMTVTGEVGSGKTMLCRVLAERLPGHIDVVYLANPSLSPDELLLAIAEDLGDGFNEIRPSARVRQLQNILIERYAAGRQVVVLIDEAHAMPDASLEEVRLLSNLDHGHHKLLQIVLFGQSELNQRLAEAHLRQLRERITYRFELGPISRADLTAYIDWRLRAAGYTGASPFGPQALNLLASAAQGLTRRINILADKALLAAYADGKHEVSAQHVRIAIKDCRLTVRRPIWQLLAAIAALCSLGVGLIYALQVSAPSQESAASKTASMIMAPATRQPATTPRAASAMVAASLPVSIPSPTTAPTPTAPVLALTPEEDVASSHRLLALAPAGATAIMLGSSDAAHQGEMKALYAKVKARLPAGQVLILPARLNKRMGWGVFYGFFPDRASAQKAMARLPTDLSTSKPFIRTAEGMKNELLSP